MQVYIVTGGVKNCNYPSLEASTEILLKDGGTAWKEVAKLPVLGKLKNGQPNPNGGRIGVQGLGFENGKFIITGEIVFLLYILHFK